VDETKIIEVTGKEFQSTYPLPNLIHFFVHDGINSVADYNLLRVGVGCRMDVWMSCVPVQISRLDNFKTP
jgi:hypothetical protein